MATLPRAPLVELERRGKWIRGYRRSWPAGLGPCPLGAGSLRQHPGRSRSVNVNEPRNDFLAAV